MVILKGKEMLQVGREKGSTPKESKIRGIPLYRRKGMPAKSLPRAAQRLRTQGTERLQRLVPGGKKSQLRRIKLRKKT